MTAAEPAAKQYNDIINNIVVIVILKESSTEESPLERETCRKDALTEILHCVQYRMLHDKRNNNTFL